MDIFDLRNEKCAASPAELDQHQGQFLSFCKKKNKKSYSRAILGCSVLAIVIGRTLSSDDQRKVTFETLLSKHESCVLISKITFDK